MASQLLRLRRQPSTHDVEQAGAFETEDDEPSSEALQDLLKAIRAARLIQNQFRLRHYKQRLDYRNLTDRLLFEHELFKGLWRLILQVSIFVLLIVSARVTRNSAQRAGLKSELTHTLGLDDLEGITSRQSFLEDYLPKLSLQSKEFFPLGVEVQPGIVHLSRRLSCKEGVIWAHGSCRTGAIEVLKHKKSFLRAVELKGINLNVALSEFSLTAWVRMSRQFVSGYILRKRVGMSASSSPLSCWGWYLSEDHGQQLHFGGHDYFPTSSSKQGDVQHAVGPQEQTSSLVKGTDYLLTVRVVQNRSSASNYGVDGRVTFFVGDTVVADLPLMRDITDCNNDLEGPLLGHAGLALAQVRFYPVALSRSAIKEIMSAGEMLKEMVSGNSIRSPFAQSDAIQGQQDLPSDLSQILQTSDDHKLTSQLIDLVAAARDEASVSAAGGGANSSVADAPHGAIGAKSTSLEDSDGNQYYSLFLGPGVLSKPTSMNDDDTVAGPRVLLDVPSFKGSSATISWWHRHNTVAECRQLSSAACGLYFLYTRNSRGLCWSVWLESNGIYFEHADGANQYPRGFLSPEHELTATKAWRHVAFALDASDDTVTFYLDGRKGWTGRWGAKVSTADCDIGSGRKVAFGRQFTNWTYGLEVGVYDLRLYVGRALPPASVLKLAASPGAALSSADMCIDAAGSTGDITDKLWLDSLGRGCEWYYFNKHRAPSMCELKDPSANCPVACVSRQPCFRPRARQAEFFLWERVRMMTPKSANGSICVNDRGSGLASGDDGQGAQDLRSLCQRWVKRNGEGGSRADWVADFEQRTGHRIDFYNLTSVCDDVEKSVDAHCSFHSKTVEDFTHASAQNGGDFTLAFWMRPVGSGSLTEGKFTPNVYFYSSLFPPTHNVALGGYTLNPNGEARLHSACLGQRGDRIFENIATGEASREGWTFFALVRKNSAPFRNTVMTNNGVGIENPDAPFCLYNESAMFSAIEVNQPMLISPIMLVPEALQVDTLQRRYYASVSEMRKRRGPLMMTGEREASMIPLEKYDYAHRNSLVAPPMIFQTRSAAAACKSNYSRLWISTQNASMVERRCATPNSCPASAPPVTCSAPEKYSGANTFFGLTLIDFASASQGTVKGYSDFLYSITDNAALYRDGALQATSAFMDWHTASLEIVLPFFSPSDGVTTVVNILADFTKQSGIRVSSSVDFYGIVDEGMATYCVLQSVACVLVCFLGALLWYTYKEALSYQDEMSWGTTLQYMADIIVIILIPSAFVAGQTFNASSQVNTKRIIDNWEGIDWASTSPLGPKKAAFFQGVQNLNDTMSWTMSLETLVFYVMLVNVVRTVAVTSLHPRLALLTGTIGYAAETLAHAFLVAALVLFMFAYVGAWRYGQYREDFMDVSVALVTELSVMFSSDPPDGWGSTMDGEFMFFIFTYLLFMFILVLNFIMAIIVDAYVKVVKDIEDCKVEQNFWEDAFATMSVHLMRKQRGWPSITELGHKLASQKAKLSIGYNDLLRMELFAGHGAIVSFLAYYSRYDFTVPERVTKYGRAARTLEERVAISVEKRMAHLFGVKPPSLMEQALAHKKMPPHNSMTTSDRHVALENMRQNSLRQIPYTHAQAVEKMPFSEMLVIEDEGKYEGGPPDQPLLPGEIDQMTVSLFSADENGESTGGRPSTSIASHQRS